MSLYTCAACITSVEDKELADASVILVLLTYASLNGPLQLSRLPLFNR